MALKLKHIKETLFVGGDIGSAERNKVACIRLDQGKSNNNMSEISRCVSSTNNVQYLPPNRNLQT